MIKFICYPKCTTCQRAQKWLDSQGVSYELRDIKLDNPSLAELTEWYNKSGLPIRKFFNTSEMNEVEMLSLLATDGMLVKRPIVVTEDAVLVGFKESDWEKIIK